MQSFIANNEMTSKIINNVLLRSFKNIYLSKYNGVVLCDCKNITSLRT
jgi:hypothetical protein